MSVLPGAEPYSHQGGPTGVLLCHGFTGSPGSLRPWAEYLAAEGLTVSLPRLPGHGTTWQEMNRTRWEDWYAEVDRAFGELQATSDDIFLMGLSMGLPRSPAGRTARRRGPRARAGQPVGDRGYKAVPARARDEDARSVAQGRGQRHQEGQASTELAYDRTPTKAAATLPGLWKVTQRDLGKVTAADAGLQERRGSRRRARRAWRSCARSCRRPSSRSGSSRTAIT